MLRWRATYVNRGEADINKEATLEGILELEKELESKIEQRSLFKSIERRVANLAKGIPSVAENHTARQMQLERIQNLFMDLLAFEEGPLDYLTKIGNGFEKHIKKIYGVNIMKNDAIASRIEKWKIERYDSQFTQLGGSGFRSSPMFAAFKVRQDVLSPNQGNRNLARLTVREITDKMH